MYVWIGVNFPEQWQMQAKIIIKPRDQFGAHFIRKPYERAPTISPVPTNSPTRPTNDFAFGRAAVDPTAVGSTRAYIERINPVWAKVNINSAIWRVDATASASLRAVNAIMVFYLLINTNKP